MMNYLTHFPDSCTIDHNAINIAGCDLTKLAEQYGTPLYLYDRVTLDNQVRAYKEALAGAYPGRSSLTYAGKAYLCIAIAEWTRQHDLWVDCSGYGELAIVKAAGLSPERVLVHGVNKSTDDLVSACDNAGVIVVDNLTELKHLAELSKSRPIPKLWLRFQPGLAVKTHSYTQTGQSGSKFGMDFDQMVQAAKFCRAHSLSLTGIHFHLGSHFRDPAPLIPAIHHALELVGALKMVEDWTLSVGGGWGVSYNESELPQPDLSEYIHLVAGTVVEGSKQHNISKPVLNLEPGRSLVARAGVAVYRVGAIKSIGGRKWVLLDGGLADNPRPALYHSQYQVFPLQKPNRPREERVSFAGPYCESGDVLIESLPFPEIHENELVVVPVSGAYQLSMSSNYNGARRPAVLWLDQGHAQVIQERETAEDLYRMDQRLVKSSIQG